MELIVDVAVDLCGVCVKRLNIIDHNSAFLHLVDVLPLDVEMLNLRGMENKRLSFF